MFGIVLSQDGYLRDLDAILFPSGNILIVDFDNKNVIYSDLEEFDFTPNIEVEEHSNSFLAENSEEFN